MKRRVAGDRRCSTNWCGIGWNHFFNDHRATRKVFGVVRNFANVLVRCGQPGSAVTIGVRDGARATKFGPDFVRVAVVLRIGVIEVGRPIGDRRELFVQVFGRCHEGVRQSFRNRDGEFGAIGQSQSSLVFKFGRH